MQAPTKEKSNRRLHLLGNAGTMRRGATYAFVLRHGLYPADAAVTVLAGEQG